MRAVLRALGRLHRKEDLSAVMIVFHVQKEKSVIRQVTYSPSHSFKENWLVVIFVFFFSSPGCIFLSKELINKITTK